MDYDSNRCVSDHLLQSPRETPPSLRAKQGKPVFSKKNYAPVTRVEIKLQQRLKANNQKLNQKRKEKETQQMDELRDRPQINKNSRKLAKIAESKFLENCSNSSDEQRASSIRETPYKTPEKPKYEQFRPKNSIKIPTAPLVNRKSILKPQIPTEEKARPQSAAKPRKKSIYYMSVLERSEYWVRNKQEKLKKLREIREYEKVKECTFTPFFHSKVPGYSQKCTPVQMIEYSNARDSGTLMIRPQFESLCSDQNDVRAMYYSILPPEYFPISPYQVKVSFPEGCNLGSFLSRRKDSCK